MKVFAVSDVHVDYRVNKQWLRGLSSVDYREDILILAGDLTGDLSLLEQCLRSLAIKFHKVLFVPGNHELRVVRDKIKSSLQKFHRVLVISSDCGVWIDVYRQGPLSILPLFGWYDFSFGQPCAKLRDTWSDFRTCIWPDSYTERHIVNYFISRNSAKLATDNQTLISFSHFLPRIDVMPWFTRRSQRYLYPVLGSYLL